MVYYTYVYVWLVSFVSTKLFFFLFFSQRLLSLFTSNFKLQNPGEENCRELFRFKKKRVNARKVMNSIENEMRKNIKNQNELNY